MIVTISLVGPDALTRGMLRNLFLEPQPNLFVGPVNNRQLTEILRILECGVVPGVVIAQSNSSPIAVRIKQIGRSQRKVVEIDGIQLIKR